MGGGAEMWLWSEKPTPADQKEGVVRWGSEKGWKTQRFRGRGCIFIGSKDGVHSGGRVCSVVVRADWGGGSAEKGLNMAWEGNGGSATRSFANLYCRERLL